MRCSSLLGVWQSCQKLDRLGKRPAPQLADQIDRVATNVATEAEKAAVVLIELQRRRSVVATNVPRPVEAPTAAALHGQLQCGGDPKDRRPGMLALVSVHLPET